jgi:hypothetical protein
LIHLNLLPTSPEIASPAPSELPFAFVKGIKPEFEELSVPEFAGRSLFDGFSSKTRSQTGGQTYP